MNKNSPLLGKLAALLLAAGIGLNASAAGTAAPATTGTPLPVQAFFKKPVLGSPTLSPSGKKIAMLVSNAEGRIGLAVADIATPNKFKGVAQFPDADIRSVSWVNDERLVFDLTDRQAALGMQLGSGLYAVNADGSDFLWLIERTGNYRVSGNSLRRPLPERYVFMGTLNDGTDDVMVQRYIPTGQGHPATTMMMRLNTRTMGTRSIFNEAVPDGVQAWLLDRDKQPRAVVTTDGKRKGAVHWRDPGTPGWTELYRFDPTEGEDAITPVAIDRDGQLYVRALNTEAKDGTSALYRYDVKARKLEDKPMLSLPGFDFAGGMLFDAGSKALLGVSYMQEAEGVTWFDPKMRSLQEAVDKLLPSTNNEISCSRCVEARHVIVTASSDIQAPVHFLFDNQTGKLQLLGASRPWLDSAAMAGTQDFQRVKTRDGFDIPVYVTKPKGKGPFPTVVMVHGGPYVRGVEWGFNPANQFLASRGYLVVEPEFRGSTGYGSKLFKAGWKQWGLAMQDDITDATRWAIAQGLADPKRVAIVGGSYGGYATMMGLVKEPELYKAGVNIVGVTDIELMYSIGWSDFMDADNPWVRYGMPRMIGDPSKDAAQLAATSPLKQAARIKQPVLMAYGEEDYRVPLPHGTKMRDALIAAGNRNVEWVQYAEEGHGFNLEKNNVDFWTRVERFLDKHVK
ncbi:S9 family peptidase [Massilia sp. Dwa41.01b]|uniref:alpha/beta hydrolase family protein n=1 Tax=unclassified Massilia TaxID=2609279 RepID=UPI0016022F7C|nr:MULTISPECIES: S9 family peptidase [unclassified Massilia]QNA88178.1 S9 family peptidase [Massilia sp. Dwa41.01b]QNA99083.1 S9 family peptidase [Massilia sp. Se16.2.3]